MKINDKAQCIFIKTVVNIIIVPVFDALMYAAIMTATLCHALMHAAIMTATLCHHDERDLLVNIKFKSNGACSDPQPHSPNFFQTSRDFGTRS